MTHLPGTASQRGAGGKSGIDFGLQSAPDAPASASVPFLGMQVFAMIPDWPQEMRQMSTSKINKQKSTEIHEKKNWTRQSNLCFCLKFHLYKLHCPTSNSAKVSVFKEHPHLATAVP